MLKYADYLKSHVSQLSLNSGDFQMNITLSDQEMTQKLEKLQDNVGSILPVALFDDARYDKRVDEWHYNKAVWAYTIMASTRRGREIVCAIPETTRCICARILGRSLGLASIDENLFILNSNDPDVWQKPLLVITMAHESAHLFHGKMEEFCGVDRKKISSKETFVLNMLDELAARLDEEAVYFDAVKKGLIYPLDGYIKPYTGRVLLHEIEKARYPNRFGGEIRKDFKNNLDDKNEYSPTVLKVMGLYFKYYPALKNAAVLNRVHALYYKHVVYHHQGIKKEKIAAEKEKIAAEKEKRPELITVNPLISGRLG